MGQSLNGSGFSVWSNIIKVGKELDNIGIHLSSSFEWEVAMQLCFGKTIGLV